MNLEERVEQLEFQMELLFENRGIDRLFFESKITRAQFLHIVDLMDHVCDKILLRECEPVLKQFFEEQIYSIVPEKNEDSQFCELITKYWHAEQQWPEVYEHLYGSV